jgi:hypothetical protein
MGNDVVMFKEDMVKQQQLDTITQHAACQRSNHCQGVRNHDNLASDCGSNTLLLHNAKCVLYSQHRYTWVAGLTVIPTNVSQRGNNHVAATWYNSAGLVFGWQTSFHSWIAVGYWILYFSWPTSWPILPLNGNRNFGFAQNNEQIIKRLYLHPSSGAG